MDGGRLEVDWRAAAKGERMHTDITLTRELGAYCRGEEVRGGEASEEVQERARRQDRAGTPVGARRGCG